MKRYRHNLSHYKLMGCDQGQLVPIACVDVLPGDSFRHATSILCRVAPLVLPVMHPISIRVHSFFVPNRLLWSGWEGFITGKDNTSVPTVTFLASFGSNNYELADHLGIPGGGNPVVSALPFRAYNMIWNEYYRDQDLDTAVATDQLRLLKCRWEKDYFTTARLNPQQSGQATVPVNLPDTIVADSLGDFSIKDWRVAMATQKIKEARNRFGSRYTDYLRFLGINPSDARMQKPEYLGGGTATISFSEVLSTADVGEKGVGDYVGHGIASLRTRPYRRFFEEHGYVITLFSSRPKTIYQNVVPRHFGRLGLHDFWQREDEMLGEQPIYIRELWQQHPNAKDVFGWGPRHQDYRHVPSQIGGAFRVPGESAPWHLARSFSAAPVLNSSFVECVPPNHIYADQNAVQLKMMIYHSVQARRLVSSRARNP